MVLWTYLNSVLISTSARRDVLLRMHGVFGFGGERSLGVRHCGVVVLKLGCREPRLSARLGFYRARLGWGCEPTCDSIAATVEGRQARWVACWGIPE
jgi:hypothetical protein